MPKQQGDTRVKTGSLKSQIAQRQTDKKTPQKQCHAAKRVYGRLKEQTDFNCGYRLVTGYVSLKKKELNVKWNENYFSLIHRSGGGQADFESISFYENVRYHEKGRHLMLSFPCGNGAYMQLNYGENMECPLEEMFVEFISLIFLSCIQNKMNEKVMSATQTMHELLDKPELYRVWKSPIRDRILLKHVQICGDLGVTPLMASEHTSGA